MQPVLCIESLWATWEVLPVLNVHWEHRDSTVSQPGDLPPPLTTYDLGKTELISLRICFSLYEIKILVPTVQISCRDCDI